jgi:hypothetical protein
VAECEDYKAFATRNLQIMTGAEESTCFDLHSVTIIQ